MENNNEEIIALLEKERQRIENIYDSDLEEDLDDQASSSEDEVVDHNNYKGIYIDDEPGQKFTDPETGAHFDFSDMCGRLKSIERERKSVEARMQKLVETSDHNIYKTHDRKEAIKTKFNKNKEEIIRQLNHKLSVGDTYGKKEQKKKPKGKAREPALQIGSTSSKFQKGDCFVEAMPAVILNDPETVSSIATKGGQLPTKKSQFDVNTLQRAKTRDYSNREKSGNFCDYRNLISTGMKNSSISSSKGGCKLKRNDKSFASMLQFGDINSSKNCYRNASFRNRGSLQEKYKKAMRKSHSKHSNKNNIILENMKPQKSKNKKLRKFKRSKGRKASEIVIPLGSNYKLKKILQGSIPTLPLAMKKPRISEMRGSRERSHRRSKPKNKWKSSPYRKKLASKLHKLKTLASDTPEGRKSSAYKKKTRISEYSNFMHGNKNKQNISLKTSQSSKKKSSESRSIEKRTPMTDNYHKLKFHVKGNSRNRHRSKTKSEKLGFLTLNG